MTARTADPPGSGAVLPGAVLPASVWLTRARAHAERADAFTAAHRHRARRGEAHPVWDFLFSYYSLRPGHLRVWHPGYGTALAGPEADRYLRRAGYLRGSGGVSVGPDYLRSRIPTVGFVAGLLRATAAREPQFGCFGMHEWAMVYRTEDIRHAQLPLRLGRAGTDAVLESMPLRCSHFDAYRFFTAAAVPRNRHRLTRATQPDREQPGCLHANMDLFKWALKLGPLVDSGLMMDCLDLAAAARELDMRASPYELGDYGFDAIAVEDPAGRADYVRAQAAIARRAAPLRDALLRHCTRLLEFSPDPVSERPSWPAAMSEPPGPADRIN